MIDSEWDVAVAYEKAVLRRATMKDESSARHAKELIEEALPVVTMSMIHLALHSPTDSVRFNASRYVMDRALGKIDDQLNPDSKPAWEALLEDVVVEAEGYVE